MTVRVDGSIPKDDKYYAVLAIVLNTKPFGKKYKFECEVEAGLDDYHTLYIPRIDISGSSVDEVKKELYGIIDELCNSIAVEALKSELPA